MLSKLLQTETLLASIKQVEQVEHSTTPSGKQSPEVFCKEGVLRNFAKFTGKHLCQSFFFNKVLIFKKESLAQVFSCEFYEISKNTFSYRTRPVAVSALRKLMTEL